MNFFKGIDNFLIYLSDRVNKSKNFICQKKRSQRTLIINF